MQTIPDFEQFDFTAEGATRPVYYQGTGPAVILLHELPGMIPECLDFARAISSSGFSVFLPLLLGEPNQPFTIPSFFNNLATICLSREFYCFARNQSSPITNWLRKLCQEVNQRSNEKGVGVIGMCLTGGFVLSLLVDPSVVAPVLSQPSLPMPLTSSHREALGISPEELAIAKARVEAGVRLLALRFSEDGSCPAARFASLKKEFGDNLETIEIDSSRNNQHNIQRSAHSVLTLHFIDNPNHPTYHARERVISFLHENLDLFHS